jgi:hypothetical protein
LATGKNILHQRNVILPVAGSWLLKALSYLFLDSLKLF